MATPSEKLPNAENVLDFWFGELDAHGRADKLHQDRWWARAPEFDAALDRALKAAAPPPPPKPAEDPKKPGKGGKPREPKPKG